MQGGIRWSLWKEVVGVPGLGICEQKKTAFCMFALPGSCACGGFPKLGVPFGRPYNKDYSILGSILGPLVLGDNNVNGVRNDKLDLTPVGARM